ncbi:28S rRNA (cytosine-C(5))-methyltransferase isoform X2 [Tripterygium wilfordii]|uniref:28S rRNA (Cytosine-C(5))-methyltransferase isoform X2 n=1 Tax=Tripterygium wilfordii TaxID=458696 RepID=A0A7J7DPX6_TRIWF|nr:28S rRNA (cytosine-C(5))-methyltransferase isoform X2 [Tripterygium wilfordii]
MVSRQSLAAAKESKGHRRRSGAERSACYARKEAAKVLRSFLQGDARKPSDPLNRSFTAILLRTRRPRSVSIEFAGYLS